MPLATFFNAGREYSGSSRMALACGVRTFVTAALNSVMDSGATWSVEMLRPWAIAFISEPR